MAGVGDKYASVGEKSAKYRREILSEKRDLSSAGEKCQRGREICRRGRVVPFGHSSTVNTHYVRDATPHKAWYLCPDVVGLLHYANYY